jgi:hypothetical protein
MQDVKELIERIEPAPSERGDWGAVVRDAQERPRLHLARPLATIAAAAAALFALALFQPWQSSDPTLLERALAAVGEGPVLHVVLRGEWGGTNVALDTGERTPVYGETETWYDPDRRLVHMVSRLGDVVQNDEVFEPQHPPKQLQALARDYREALRSGSARVTGEDVIAGERVSWVTIHSEQLPDVADGQLHEWAQQVAVSQDTAEPVATRETRDGKEGPITRQRVLSLEMLPAGSGDFTEGKGSLDSLGGAAFMYQPFGETLTVEAAAKVLGRRPLWVGQRLGDLELAGIGLTESRAFRGPKERKQGHAIRVIRPENEIESARGIVLFYGVLGDIPETFKTETDRPRRDLPHAAITEYGKPPLNLVGGSYVPPEGSLFLRAGGRGGLLEVEDLFVLIEAESEELILAAARALEPMPG